ncbi:MAG: gamma-glutamyl-gamma-aminobutyrate hydrolase family protein [Bacillota bacterium]|jgi:putative glutamine amidotransferase|nr:MAG: gamma-glutamyl-gamma-aminobutyrate hydrolase family protein [Bacillota bacterium]
MLIATHPGTCTDVVAGIMRKHGAQLDVITSLQRAQRADFDGLILLGGADVGPYWYGEANRHAGPIDRTRDLVEWVLIRRALSEGLPVFGICRGHQMICIATGGSLYQDIHIDGATYRHGGYGHKLAKVSRPLSKHLPSDYVNSLHHQAVKTPPPGLEVAAVSEDGLVEALYRPGILGVQWHPEMLYGQDPRWGELFQWFLKGLRP